MKVQQCNKLSWVNLEVEEQLQEYVNQNKLTKYVFKDLLKGSETYSGETWLHRLKNRCEDVSHGCITGIVSSLIYYSDTVAFFKKYKEEIGEILKELATDCGSDYIYNKILEGDIFIEDVLTQNKLAWLGYEEVNYRILSILEEMED